MNDMAVKPVATRDLGEVRPVARELADAYRDRVLRHRHELGLSTAEAAAKAEEPSPLSRLRHIENCPPEQVTWADLEELNRASPGLMMHRWEEIQEAALEDLRSGHAAAAVLEGRDPHPWRRAQFLAIRAELIDGWQPRNGVERQLIDQMAQAQAGVSFWQERLYACAAVALPVAHEQAGAMVDRFSRMFTRLLRALCNLRKVPLAVVVQRGGQVNVGGQQVNVQKGPES